jgi:tRNA pseudouridine38-40 synthase
MADRMTNSYSEKRNILLKLEYCGKDFAGWQIQAKKRTVQGVLKETLERFLGHNIKITGSGRTDSGVHALAQYANFHTTNYMSARQIKYKLNCMLPSDIAVLACRDLPLSFDSRRSAVCRSYRYLISERATAINRHFSWNLGKRLDLTQLKSLGELINKAHHFDNFCKTKSRRENNDCIIMKSFWSRQGGFLRFDITANRFLHNMVRLLVGSMVAVLDGRLETGKFREMLNFSIDDKAKFIAPAHGLYLVHVGYESQARSN